MPDYMKISFEEWERLARQAYYNWRKTHADAYPDVGMGPSPNTLMKGFDGWVDETLVAVRSGHPMGHLGESGKSESEPQEKSPEGIPKRIWAWTDDETEQGFWQDSPAGGGSVEYIPAADVAQEREAGVIKGATGTDIKLLREEHAWLVVRKPDGDAHNVYVRYICAIEATARRLAKHLDAPGCVSVIRVMMLRVGLSAGSAHVSKLFLPLLVPPGLEPATEADMERQRELDAYDNAVKAALDAGLTHQQIEALRGKRPV